MIGNEYVKNAKTSLEKHYSLIRSLLALIFIILENSFTYFVSRSHYSISFYVSAILALYTSLNLGLYFYFKKGHYNRYIKYFTILVDYTLAGIIYKYYYIAINLNNDVIILSSQLIVFALILCLFNITRLLNASKAAPIVSAFYSSLVFLFVYSDLKPIFKEKLLYYYAFAFLIYFFIFLSGIISVIVSLVIKKYIYTGSSLVNDIARRKEAEDALSKATYFYENILNSISDPIFVKDDSMHYRVVNKAFCDYIGVSKDKILGANYNIFANKKEEEAARITDEITMDDKRSMEIEERFTDTLGFTRTILIKKSFLLLNGDKYLVAIMRDISSKATLEREMKRLINELKEANNDLRELTKMKEDFIAIASHDLRAPFEGILGFSNLLLNSGELSSENKEMVMFIMQSAEGQLKYVNSLLEIMNFEKGNIKLSKRKVDVNSLVGKSVNLIYVLAKKKDIKIELSHIDSVNANIDEPKIAQVLNNFITNAIKFTPLGGTVKVEIKKAGDDFFRVDVIDNGIGIDEKDAASIFDKYKVVSKGTIGEQGTGLGLYICKLMIRAHGGEIGVLKNSDKGSDFYFTLPVY